MRAESNGTEYKITRLGSEIIIDQEIKGETTLSQLFKKIKNGAVAKPLLLSALAALAR